MKECRRFFVEDGKPKIELNDTTVINGLKVTGTMYRSKMKFSFTYTADYTGYRTAMGINLWKGSVWGIGDITGKKHLLKRVNN